MGSCTRESSAYTKRNGRLKPRPPRRPDDCHIGFKIKLPVKYDHYVISLDIHAELFLGTQPIENKRCINIQSRQQRTARHCRLCDPTCNRPHIVIWILLGGTFPCPQWRNEGRPFWRSFQLT